MSTSDMKKAREWAEWAGKKLGVAESHANALAAAEVIQSLPNIVVDGEEIITIYDKYRDDAITLHEAFRDVIALLPTPPLPTLADMAPEGRERCQWMQCSLTLASDFKDGVIIKPLPDDVTAQVLFPNGALVYVPHRSVVPRPDLPPMKWPGSGDAPTIAEQENVAPDQQVNPQVNLDSSLPRPEDVPVGEAWLVKHGGHEWVGTRESSKRTRWPWTLARLDGADYGIARDEGITLVSRLVPEVKP